MKKCPNCDSEKLEKISETEFYCPDCDITFKLEKGKVKVSTEGKGRLQKIEEDVAVLQKKQDELLRYLFRDDEESPLPFI